jgi:hypothetical protein
MAMSRLAGGRIAEQWDQADILGLLRQLGVFPPPRLRRHGASRARAAATTRRSTMSLMIFSWQELDRFARTFEDLFYRGDAATTTTFYAEDAKVMAPDSDPIRDGTRSRPSLPPPLKQPSGQA